MPIDIIALIDSCSVDYNTTVLQALIEQSSKGNAWSFTNQDGTKHHFDSMDGITKHLGDLSGVSSIKIGLTGLPWSVREKYKTPVHTLFTPCINISKSVERLRSLEKKCKGYVDTKEDIRLCSLASYQNGIDYMDWDFAEKILNQTVEKTTTDKKPKFKQPVVKKSPPKPVRPKSFVPEQRPSSELSKFVADVIYELNQKKQPFSGAVAPPPVVVPSAPPIPVRVPAQNAPIDKRQKTFAPRNDGLFITDNAVFDSPDAMQNQPQNQMIKPPSVAPTPPPAPQTRGGRGRRVYQLSDQPPKLIYSGRHNPLNQFNK